MNLELSPRGLGGLYFGLVALAGTAHASETVCFEDTVPLTPTNWASSVTVSKFDPDLGVLTGIEFTLSGLAEGSAGIESLDATPTTVMTAFQATITLTRPDLSTITAVTPQANFSDDLTAFDGIIDYGGTSGITHGGIQTGEMETTSSPPPGSDLALFTGPGGAPGTIELPVDALGTSTANGSGNLITQFMTSAEATVEVCYLYELDCNGNGIPDSEDIQAGTSNDADMDGIPDECQPGDRPFCEGDGSGNGGVDCPCMNNGNFGEGCDNGSGSGGLLTGSGVPSVSNDTYMLTASQIPASSPGFFYFQLSTPAAPTPFGNGINCIPTGTPYFKVDGGGTIPQNGFPPISMLLGLQPGDKSYFQYWYRNPQSPCPGTTWINATNGVETTWGL